MPALLDVNGRQTSPSRMCVSCGPTEQVEPSTGGLGEVDGIRGRGAIDYANWKKTRPLRASS